MKLHRSHPPDDVPFRALFPFLVIAFAVAWSVLAAFIFFPDAMQELFGQLTGTHPLFFLAVYAPAIAAFAVVARHCGVSGARRFCSRLLLWRCPAWWWVYMLVGIPLIFTAGAAIKGNLPEGLFQFESVGQVLAALGVMLILGPVEEFGWRGVALPLLQRRFTPFTAGVVLGVVWGVWHLPAFFLSGTPQGGWGFMPFFVGAVSISLILTPLFNVSGGSLLLAAFYHYQLINPLWPDGQPYDTYIFVLAAAVVTYLNRTTLFTRGAGVQTVVPGG